MPITVQSEIKEPIILNLGVIGPFTDLITKNGGKEVGELEEVKFYMRTLFSRLPFIEGESAEYIKDIEGQNVKYELTEEDVANEGEYFAWWSFVENGIEYQTPEFPVIITDHGPGIGVETGAIVDGVSDHMPTTANALKKSPEFGERRMQKIATLIQLRVLKSSVEPELELIAYELPLLDYLSKRVALELCTPGIDYWSRQQKTSTKIGPTEIVSYPDMIANLEKLRERLVCELEENWREIAFFVPGIKQRKVVPMPGSSLEFYDTPEANGKLRRREIPLGFVTRNPNDTQRLVTGLGIYELGFWPAFL